MSNAVSLPSVSDLFSVSWKDYKNRFELFFMISVIANAVVLVLQLIQMYIDDTSWFLIVMIVFLIATIYVSVWSQAALTLAVRSGEKSDWQSFFKQSQDKVPTLFWASILTGLVVLVGFILIVIPGVIFAIWFAFTSFFIMYENKGVIDSMKASKELVKDNVFNLFVRWIALIVAGLIISVVAGAIAGSNLLVANIISAAVSTLIAPFAVLYGYHLFTALKRHTA